MKKQLAPHCTDQVNLMAGSCMDSNLKANCEGEVFLDCNPPMTG